MRKKILEKKLARLNAKKLSLNTRCQASSDVNEVRELTEQLEDINAEIEETQAEIDAINAEEAERNAQAEMEAREVEELIAGQYIVRWTSVLSNRFDSTSFKKVLPDLYKAYTKQVSSRRFSISV